MKQSKRSYRQNLKKKRKKIKKTKKYIRKLIRKSKKYHKLKRKIKSFKKSKGKAKRPLSPSDGRATEEQKRQAIEDANEHPSPVRFNPNIRPGHDIPANTRSIYYGVDKNLSQYEDFDTPLKRKEKDVNNIHFFSPDKEWVLKTYLKEGNPIRTLFEYFLKNKSNGLQGTKLQNILNEIENSDNSKLISLLKKTWRKEDGHWYRMSESSEEDRQFFSAFRIKYPHVDYIETEPGDEAWGAKGGEVIILDATKALYDSSNDFHREWSVNVLGKNPSEYIYECMYPLIL